MPKLSIIILTKNRSELLKKALASVLAQTFTDYEVFVVNDGSTDETLVVLRGVKIKDLKIINHESSLGITQSRQEALMQATGEYVAILDDDDEWVDPEKLEKQARYLDSHPQAVLVGGGRVSLGLAKFRPESDQEIRNTMLLRNNFFTSTVMFRRQPAISAGGFKKDGADLAEDYDLWLRLGKSGKMYNFREVFTNYRLPSYNKEKFRQFLNKQLKLIKQHKNDYSFYYLASLILRLRLLF